MPCTPIVQEPLLFYRCVFDGLEWQRSMYGQAAIRAVLQGFLDSHLTSAAQLLVQSFCSHLAHLPVLQSACDPLINALWWSWKIGALQG